MKQNKFISIYTELQEKIENGTYVPDTKLPSEHELTELYSTSRETARKALNLLAQNGYIQKVKGKGSIVLDVGKFNFPVSGLVSFKELANKMGKEVSTEVHEVVLIDPDSFLRRQLNIQSDEKVWKVVRTREIEGERIILDQDFFLESIVPTLTQEICERSIYEYLEGELQLPISFAKKEITVERASETDKMRLDLKDYEQLVLVKNFVYLEDARLFQYTESRHRLDKFRFVDFARRSHS
ncbi:trehalose operon repressor [Alkalihalobacillus sp. AL-G]|uniref:trehalose operon repressor n=1 Tax=Alkalihalobacillus sp. AL-G TaxID=2926399 RepID=UPI00272C83FC|nr:trehalose operon repressor [Alkalihalobacillus sp. AL-G]WLD95241.1 trehalose operon repressor [Alkalihalobacillus sp. AL-G]